jgi:hypothetical protein
MNNVPSPDDRVKRLIAAFDSDNYFVDQSSDVIVSEGFIGIRATHKTAVIGSTGKKKKVYYIEGNPYTMGYLTGKLAETEIERMCTDFNDNIVFDFINWHIKDDVLRKILGEIIEDIVNLISQGIYQDIPKKFIEELEGILTGCKEVHPKTHVGRKSLWVLNVGIDAILSYIYTGILPLEKKYPIELKPHLFKVPIMCNGFAARGTNPQTRQPYHFIGRDFMFPTADVYQDTAAMIVRRPVEGNPTVGVAAPGMIGTVAGINSRGVGVGVDMLPSANCNPSRAGLNSLLLTRLSIENGATCREAADIMINSQRGVSWAYILGDGTTDEACVVEGGMSIEELDFLQYAENWAVKAMEKTYPQFKDLLKNPSAPVQNGLMVRRDTYAYPPIYQTLNQELIKQYKEKEPSYPYSYDPQDFGERNYLNKIWTDKNCPGPYYFAPQRENVPTVTLVTNHCVVPEMRLCAMNWWTSIIASGHIDDMQWRYDELNNELMALCDKGYMTYDEAKETIDYLAPYHKFPDYYNKDKKPLDQVQIHGSVSILDLKQCTIETHYGYFSDEWIKISLKGYIG